MCYKAKEDVIFFHLDCIVEYSTFQNKFQYHLHNFKGFVNKLLNFNLKFCKLKGVNMYKTNKDLIKKWNLSVTYLTSKTFRVGNHDFPYIKSYDVYTPDYLALYSEKKNYHLTTNTTIGFFQFDDEFDGIHGLFNAIYYNNKPLLKKFKERFKDCKYFIAPDYTICHDLDDEENRYRLYRSRIVCLWFILELNCIVIPLITYTDESFFELMTQGLEDCEVVAFSTKGSLKNPESKDMLIKAVKYTTDKLNKLKKIIVYDVCINNNNVDECFAYPKSKNIEVVVPDNILKNQNIKNYTKRKSNGKTK